LPADRPTAFPTDFLQGSPLTAINDSPTVRRRDPRPPALCRVALVVVAAALPTLGSCRPSKSAEPPPAYLGDFRDVGPSVVEPEFRDDWDALARARERDPAAAEVAEAADRLLARQPPADVRFAALLAKAEQAYLAHEDARAIVVVDEALGTGADAPPETRLALGTVRLRAQVRSGDPASALSALDDLSGLPEEERRGLRAVALDRDGQRLEALVAHARWRALLEQDDPAAAYAEERFMLLSAGVGSDPLLELAAALPEEPARDCLRVRAGVDPPAGRPAWVARCGRAVARVGILLPRTGPLSALADTQLAAASVAAGMLTDEGGVEILWRDAGSTPKQATAAARGLLADGADVLVGPIGASNARAVSEAVGRRAQVILPGERIGDASGVAPSLEARIEALTAHAKARGVARVLVAAPDNAYGRRAVAAIRASLEPSLAKSMIIQNYSPDTTTFAPVVGAFLPALRRNAAVIVPDHLSRVELFVRQLARSGKAPSDPESPLVLSTAEGASPGALQHGNVLDGVWVAPAAAETADSGAFVEAYTAAQGEPPGDQALLVYRALQRAMGGGADPSVRPRLMRVERGRLVPANQSQG
jgi:ABC-type branched-subunit amino acid transport system substrate-binding protein